MEALSAARVFDLEQRRHPRAPIHPAHVPPGYSYLLHRHHDPGASTDARTGAAGVLITSEHAGTHIDALSHQAENMTLFGGRPVEGIQTPSGFRELGAESMPPMVGRGVLVDLAPGERTAPGRAVSLAEVRSACADQGVEPRAGDVFLVRTGNARVLDNASDYLRGAGMAGEVSAWLAGVGVAAVGADNVAWDWIEGVDPATGTTLPGHVLLLVRAGIHIIENLWLEDLAASGAREFAFVCLPLKLRGATGSPVRPIALVT